MTNAEMNQRIKELKELEELAAELKQEAEAIKNYVLFGQITPKQPLTGAMDPKTWNNIWTDLSNSAKLVQETAKAMVKSLETGMKTLEAIRKKEEAEANKGTTTPPAGANNPQATANANTQTQNQQPQKTNAQQLYEIFQQIAKTYQINVINAITNTFFNTYYGAYREIIAAYNTQSKNVNPEATATPVPDNTAPANPAPNQKP